MHQILPRTRILPDNPAAGRTSARTGLITRSRPTPIGAAGGTEAEVTAFVLAQHAKVADLLRQVPGEFSLTRDGTTVTVRVTLARTGGTGGPGGSR
jgi:hypothetical protein